MPRGRFAPSPTGDLHLGGARTAIAAWLAARRDGGSFVIRTEDLDPPRVVPGAAARILDDLRWLGLDWDEGPDAGGPFAPYVQSERSALYSEAIEHLRAIGRVFPCWCSRAEVARASGAPHAGEEGPRYPGTCRDLDPDRARTSAAQGRRPSLRLRVEAGEVVAFDDAVCGPQRQDVGTLVGDFVLRRSDGLWAYQLAVVVDDLVMGVAEVVRGDDLLASAPRQILLGHLLQSRLGGAWPPAFAHLPLVLGPDGKRLSKRHGAIAVRALREAGVPAPQVVGRLAATLGLCAASDALTPRDLLAGFRFSAITRAPTVLDPAAW